MAYFNIKYLVVVSFSCQPKHVQLVHKTIFGLGYVIHNFLLYLVILYF